MKDDIEISNINHIFWKSSDFLTATSPSSVWTLGLDPDEVYFLSSITISNSKHLNFSFQFNYQFCYFFQKKIQFKYQFFNCKKKVSISISIIFNNQKLDQFQFQIVTLLSNFFQLRLWTLWKSPKLAFQIPIFEYDKTFLVINLTFLLHPLPANRVKRI